MLFARTRGVRAWDSPGAGKNLFPLILQPRTPNQYRLVFEHLAVRCLTWQIDHDVLYLLCVVPIELIDGRMMCGGTSLPAKGALAHGEADERRALVSEGFAYLEVVQERKARIRTMSKKSWDGELCSLFRVI